MSSNKKTKLNGSVLYTIVAVMTILTVFVFSALALSVSANRRAHNNYANNQTQFTARSVVDLVWDSIQKDSSLRNRVSNLDKDNSLNISVEGLDNSMGRISQAYIKCIDNINGNRSYKLTVTAEMVGHENTVSAYYAVNPTTTRPLFEYGLRTYQESAFDNLIVLGGTCTGVDYLEYVENGVTSKNLTSINNSNSKYNSPIHIKGDCEIRVPESIILNQKSGMVVQGNIYLTSSNGNIIPNLSYKSKGYMDLPYIYSYMHYYGDYGGGKIDLGGIDIDIGRKDRPVLVIAQNITGSYSSVQPIYGDLYLLGRDRISDISKYGVQPFNGDVVKIAGLSSYTGGNIYSLGTVNYHVQSNVKIDGTTKGIANNIIADKMFFKMNYDQTIETTGAIVANEVGIEARGTYNFNKGLFVDPYKFACIDEAVINGEKYIGDNMRTVIPVSISKVSRHEVDGNKYWNADKDGFTSESHDYYFDLAEFEDADGTKITDGNNWDYILDSVKINYTPNLVYNNQWTNQLKLNAVDLKAGIINGHKSSRVYGTDLNEYLGSGYAVNDSKTYYTDRDNNLIDVKFKSNKVNDFGPVLLQNGENTITFKMDGMWGASGETVSTVDTENIEVNAHAVSKNYDMKKIAEYIERVNSKAFDENYNVIYLDDIDKSVRLKRTEATDGSNYYTIEKADLRDENGNERTVTESDYKQVAYNESGIEYYYVTNENTNVKDKVICGIDGNLLYKQGVADDGTKYDISGSGWISVFTSNNYDTFLRAVGATVTFPDSLGMKYLRNGVKQYEMNRNEIRPYDDLGELNITGDVSFESNGQTKYTNINIAGVINIDPSGDAVPDTPDGNKTGYERNYGLKLARYEEYADSGIISATIYRTLHIWNWNTGRYEEENCKVKYTNLRKAGGTDTILVTIGGEGYTCDDPESNVKVYKILVDDYGREAPNGITNGLKTNTDQNACKLIDDRYLQGIWGVRSNGLRDVVDTVDKMFVVDNNTNKPINETENAVYDFDSKIITKKDGSTEPMPDTLIIIDSCTLKGVVDRDFKIITSKDKDINIKLENWFSLGVGRTIIVDDTNGRVNFLLAYEKGAQITLNGKILTENYQQILGESGDKNIYANPVINDEEKKYQYVAEDKIPDIYFYSEYYQKKKNFYSDAELAAMSEDEKNNKIRSDNGTLISRSDMTVQCGYGTIICGYFMLASARLDTNASGNIVDNYTYYFDDIPMKKAGGIINPIDHPTTMNIGGNAASVYKAQSGIIIGAVSCTQASLNNFTLVAYVNPNPRNKNGNLFSNDVPKLQYYQAY